MITFNFPQESDEWKEIRLGKPTASQFNRIMTLCKHQAAKDTYLYELAAETALNAPESEFLNAAMLLGKESEDKARAEYELITDQTVEVVGFCLPDENAMYGCSPDGLVGEEGGIEIKCPVKLSTFLKVRADDKIPNDYLSQIYGNLFVTERDWWDFVWFYDGMPLFVKRVVANDPQFLKWAKNFSPILEAFIKNLKEINQQLKGEIIC